MPTELGQLYNPYGSGADAEAQNRQVQPETPQIILSRHGETKLNQGKERIRGWQDVPLDDKGREQAIGLGQDINEHQPRMIVTSDLSRSAETAQIINDHLDHPVPIISMHELRPWNVGNLTGLPVSEIKPELLRLLQTKTEPAPSGESYMDFAKRFVKGFSSLAEQAIKLGGPIAVVTHSRNARAAQALVEGGTQSLLTQPPANVLLKDEDPVAPAGHVVIVWNGHNWEWNKDTVHTPQSAVAAGRSARR